MEKLSGILLTVAIGLLIYTFYPKDMGSKNGTVTSGTQASPGYGMFQFTELPEGVLARTKSIEVPKKDLAGDPILMSMDREEEELLIVQVYKQTELSKSEKGQITYYLKKPNREIQEIFNQYGVLFSEQVDISFEPQQQSRVAQVNGKYILFKDVLKTNYLWGAFQTKKFHRTLKRAKELIKVKALTQRALEKNKLTEDFIKETVLGGVGNIAVSERNKKIDEYVFKNLIDLPIEVNITAPSFQIELKPGWTPSLGPLDSSEKIILFSDYHSEVGRILIGKMPELASHFPQVYFGFRPLFPKNDRFQNLLAEVSFCIWGLAPNKYWEFMKLAVYIKQKEFEKNIYKTVAEVGMDLEPIKTCFYKQDYKKVAKYHLDYAKFLGMSSGPVVFIGGQVLSGDVSVERIGKIIRNLK